MMLSWPRPIRVEGRPNDGATMLSTTFRDLAVALGLGLLVGLQKERTESPLAGLRTFAIVTWAGAISALVGEVTTDWVVSGA